jgi:hypothetical protein
MEKQKQKQKIVLQLTPINSSSTIKVAYWPAIIVFDDVKEYM